MIILELEQSKHKIDMFKNNQKKDMVSPYFMQTLFSRKN